MYEHDKNTNFDDVGEFHEKFGLENTTYGDIGPTKVEGELLEFRIKFLVEEILEFAEATGVTLTITEGKVEVWRDPLGRQDAAKAFDALIDLVYVAMGTAHFFGFPWQQGWRLVQRANMAKVRAQKDGSDSKRGSSFDVVKPEGWTAPNIARLLTRNGWESK